MDFGSRLRRIREAQSISRRNLGEALNLKSPRTRIEQYERDGRVPRQDILDKLSKELNVSSNWLITGILDDITIQTMIMLRSDNNILQDAVNDSNECIPCCFEEFLSFIIGNENILSNSLQEEDWLALYKKIKIILEKKKVNLEKINAFLSIDEINMWRDEQEENENNQYL